LNGRRLSCSFVILPHLKTIISNYSTLSTGCIDHLFVSDYSGVFAELFPIGFENLYRQALRFGSEKLWLVNNEVGGYTILLPSEY
jgi:hypothetical protein